MDDMRHGDRWAERALDDNSHVHGEPTLDEPGRRQTRMCAESIVFGGLLALLGMNLSTVRPAWGIDSSFRVGLTEAVLDHLTFGVDVVWPYGPLGFLGGPTMLSRGLLAIAVVYQFTALTALFVALITHLTRLGLGRGATVALLAPCALAISISEMVPEIVAVTLIVVLVVLWQDGRPGSPSPQTWWVVAISGFLGGAQVLVKFGPGVLACVVVLIFAASSTRRVWRLPVAVVAIAAGFLVPWFATGQTGSALGAYFGTSLELSGGYQTAQAAGPDGRRFVLVGVVALVSFGVGVFGAYRWARREPDAWWALVPLALTAWFILKQGLVRWDAWHVVGALLVLGLVVISLRWERHLIALPIGVVIVGVLATFAAAPSQLRATWSYRADTALVLLSGDRHADMLAAAQAEVRADYAVPTQVVAAFAGGSVHADEWDINAVWANDLDWNPLPVFQSYSTYTAELDRVNASRYASASGPDGVLLNPDTVDDRYGPWESPDARVALTCNFDAVVEGRLWTALRRAPNVCGDARELRTDIVRPGESVDVPMATRPDAIVVARFDLPADPVAMILATVARPVHYAEVTIDHTTYRLVTGTAENAHIVRSPGRIGSRNLPHGRIAHSSLSFENVGPGSITIRFEEIPLRVP
jgi:hypothetical protein